MNINQPLLFVMAILTVVFNAGGFVWIAKNHIKHVSDTLVEMRKDITELQRGLARLEGMLRANGKVGN